MTQRSDEITMGNPNIIYGLAIAMLLLYWLIGKGILCKNTEECWTNYSFGFYKAESQNCEK